MIQGMPNYPAQTRAAALTRGLVRTALLLGLAAVAAWWSLDETSTGNRVLLVALAGILALLAIWGIVQTRRELRLVPSQHRPR